jgi:hypothetical protein
MSVENLDIKITVNSDQAISKLNQVKSTMNNVGKGGTGGLANNLSGIGNMFSNIQNSARASLNNVQTGIKNTNANTSTLGQSLNLFGNSLKNIAGKNEFSGIATGMARMIGTNSSLISGIGGTSSALAGMGSAGGSAFSGLIEGATGLATALGPVTVGIGLIIAGLIGLAAWSVPAAVNAMETQNAYDVKIGGQREAANKFADKMAGMGASRMAVKTQTANTYQQFRQSGQSQGEAIQTSKQVIERAYDISSQENVDQATAVKMVQQSLTGEHERMKAIGVTITDNMVKQYAYNNLGAKRGKDLSQEIKLQAELGVLMQRTNYAKGDFAATQNSSANLARKIQNQWQEVKVTVGMAFEPLWNAILRITSSSIMPFLQDLADGFLKVARGVYQAVAGIWAGVKAILNLENPIKAFKKAFDDAGKSFDTYSAAVKKRAMDAEADTDATNAETDAQKDLGKAVSDNIQSFDELHLIQKDKGGGGSPSGGGSSGLGKPATVDEVTPSSGEKLDKDKVIIPIAFGPVPPMPELPKVEAVKVQTILSDWSSEFNRLSNYVQSFKPAIEIGVVVGEFSSKLQEAYNKISEIIETNKIPIEVKQQELVNSLEQQWKTYETTTNTNRTLFYNELLNKQSIYNNNSVNNDYAFKNNMIANDYAFNNNAIANQSVFNNQLIMQKNILYNQLFNQQAIYNSNYLTSNNILNNTSLNNTIVNNALINNQHINTYNQNLTNQKIYKDLYIQGQEDTLQGALNKVIEYKAKFKRETNSTMEGINNELFEGGIKQNEQINQNLVNSYETWRKSNEWYIPISNSLEAVYGVFGSFDVSWQETLVNWANNSLSAVSAFAKDAQNNIVSFFSGIMDTAVKWANSFGSTITSAFSNFVSGIKSLASTVGVSISATIPSWKNLTNTFSALKKEFVSTIDIEGTASTLSKLGTVAVGASIIAKANAAANSVTSAASSITSSVSSAASTGVSSASSSLSSVGGVIESSVSRIAAAIIPPIFVAPGTFNNIVPGKKEKEVPQFASGGIVSKPTIGLIGEAGIPEAVVPLDQNGYLNKLVTNAVNTAVNNAMMWSNVGNSNQNSTPINLVVTLDSKTIAQQTYTHLNDISNKNGTPLVIRR